MNDALLDELPGRLELLMVHLVGDALARRVDRADLVQETMLRILSSEATAARAEEGPGALWAHARTMARRVVIDAARSARSQPRRISSLIPERRSDGGDDSLGAVTFRQPGPGPRTEAAARESAVAWLAAYRTLTPEHRRVLGLRRFEGLSAEATGARMGRSSTAVHSLFRRALAAWEEAAAGI